MPDQPPNEGTTSPPFERMVLIIVLSDPVSDRLPSHFGLQDPSERTKASVNAFTPVASIAAVGLV